jgi:hypothetical protein
MSISRIEVVTGAADLGDTNRPQAESMPHTPSSIRPEASKRWVAFGINIRGVRLLLDNTDLPRGRWPFTTGLPPVDGN